MWMPSRTIHNVDLETPDVCTHTADKSIMEHTKNKYYINCIRRPSIRQKAEQALCYTTPPNECVMIMLILVIPSRMTDRLRNHIHCT
jgi:hypothetical protein